MRNWWILFRREWRALLWSPSSYVIVVLFLVVTGTEFWILVTSMATGPEAAGGLTEFAGWGLVLTLTAIVPLLTMRLVADERRTGTLETLMTAPVTPAQVIGAKYAATLAFYVVMLLPTLAYGPLLKMWAASPPNVDPAAAAGVYLGALLIGGFFIAVGLLASTLAQAQITAGLLAFAMLALFLVAGLLPWLWPSLGGDAWAAWLSPIAHMADLARGVVDSRPMLFYGINTAWTLWATVLALEWERWR